MTKQFALKNQDEFPGGDVLEKTIGAENFTTWTEFETMPVATGCVPEWNYYKDTKAWLCKVCNKKETVCRLSVWEDGCFSVTFFFMERHLEDFAALDIPEKWTENLCLAKPIGKLLPLLIEVERKAMLPDLMKIVNYKKVAK